MTINDNRVMTIKERYLIFKEKNENKELSEFLELMENMQEEPNSQGLKELEKLKKANQSAIDNLSESDKELVERLYNLVLFNVKRETGTVMTKWDFFIDIAKRNNWEPVLEAIDVLEKNEARFEDYKTGDDTVSEQAMLEQQEYDKSDLEYLEKQMKKTIMPWAKKHVSLYYQEMIERTLQTRMRVIQARLRRNTDLAFAEWLRTTRKEKGLTLQNVADASNTSTSYIQRLEKGKRKVPSIPVVEGIADALGVPMHEVMTIISGDDEGEETPVSIYDLINKKNYTLKGQVVSAHQRNILEKIVKAALNDTGKSEIDNLMDLQNMARRLISSVEKVEQEDMSDASGMN